MRPTQDLLLRCHRDLDTTIRTDQRRCFVSGWQVENPHASDYLDAHSLIATVDKNASHYQFLSDARNLKNSIARFHRTRELVSYAEEEIFIAPGSSPLILGTMLTLHSRSIRTIYYFPPVYYAFFFWAKVLGIDMVPLSADWPALTSSELPLPIVESVLLFSDPAWVVGRFLDADLLHSITKWQARTGSLVVVDGTFQYTKWDTSHNGELSAQLVKGQTLRLVCPTKALGVNGIRFAYLLLPAELREDLRYVTSNGSGASDGFNVAAASRLMDVLNSNASNARFIEHIRTRSEALTGTLHERQPFEQNCTYYVFSRLLVADDKCLTMDQRYFEGPLHPGIRINLMVPQAELDKLAIVVPIRRLRDSREGSATFSEPGLGELKP